MNDLKLFLKLTSVHWLTYLHLERALAVVEKDDAQPEFGLLGDPGHVRECAQRPRPPLRLLHVRLCSVRRRVQPSHLLKRNHGFYALLFLGAVLFVLAMAGARVDGALTFPRLTTKATWSWRGGGTPLYRNNITLQFNRIFKVSDNTLS